MMKNKILTIFGIDYTEDDLEKIINHSGDYDLYREGFRETDYICDNSLVDFFVIYYYKLKSKSDPSKWMYLYTRSEDWKHESVIMDKDYYSEESLR